MKTTNAKAKGLQTPAPPGDTVKPEKTNRKSSNAQKVKKAAPAVQPSRTELLGKLKEDDVPDVEYAPPKPKGKTYARSVCITIDTVLNTFIELPDDPDDIVYDTTFPQFKPQNMALGWEKVYFHGEVGEDGLTQRERKFKEESIAYDKLVDEMIQKEVENIRIHEDSDEPGWEVQQQRRDEQSAKENAKKKMHARSVSTIKSRDAAAALSRLSRPASRSNTVRSSAAPQPSKASSLIAPKKKKTPAPTNPSSMRHAAATASSRTTLGYSKGRSVSSALQGKTTKAKEDKSASKSILSPEKYMQLYGPPPPGSDMWTRCKEAGLLDEEDNTDDNAEVDLPIYEEDEETRNFQLTL